MVYNFICGQGTMLRSLGEIGKSHLKTDKDCLNLSRLDMMRIKIKIEHPMKGWEASQLMMA